jgi:hypothetical protein
MTEEESWSVTAYILKINGIDPGPELNAENAAKIDLSVIDPNLGPSPTPAPVTSSPEPQPTAMPEITLTPIPTLGHEVQTNNNDTSGMVWVYGLALLIIISMFIIIILRKRTAD